MKYNTTGEWNHFDFSEAQIVELSLVMEQLSMVLDGVKILPENSCNRDIRVMACNDLHMKFPDGKVTAIVDEAYKRYDPDGKLLELHEDKAVDSANYAEKIKELNGCAIYSIEKKEGKYFIEIDSEDRPYRIEVTGEQDLEAWDRFIALM